MDLMRLCRLGGSSRACVLSRVCHCWRSVGMVSCVWGGVGVCVVSREARVLGMSLTLVCIMFLRAWSYLESLPLVLEVFLLRKCMLLVCPDLVVQTLVAVSQHWRRMSLTFWANESTAW